MVQDKTIESFFKRKRNDALALALVETELPEQDRQPSQNEEQRTTEPIIFRGIEFLERDPALRPQIWQYPQNVRDEVRRAYIQLGPMQPKLKKYKPSGPPGHQRRFQFSWFTLFPSWLEYSESSSCAYCFYCFLCNNNIKKRSGFDVFTAQGFDAWKRVNNGTRCAFLAHVGSGPCSRHNNAARDCLAILNGATPISNIIEVESNKDKERDRLRLKTSVATVKWLTVQSCAFRGHDETVHSRNGGNFLEMLKLLAELNPHIAAVDSQLNELNLKFNEKVMGLLSISVTLIPKNGFVSFNAKEICKMVGMYYPADFTQQDIIGLGHQLNHFALDASNSEDLKKPSTLTSLCRCLHVSGRHRIYNLLDRLLRLLVTLPVSTASAERAFSSLKIIKTRLRNKMEDDFLADSLLVQVEREIAALYSYEDIIEEFKGRKYRRATL